MLTYDGHVMKAAGTTQPENILSLRSAWKRIASEMSDCDIKVISIVTSAKNRIKIRLWGKSSSISCSMLLVRFAYSSFAVAIVLFCCAVSISTKNYRFLVSLTLFRCIDKSLLSFSKFSCHSAWIPFISKFIPGILVSFLPSSPCMYPALLKMLSF